jgi:hypothetical protein
MDFIHRALPYAFAIAPLGHLNNYHTTFYKNFQFDSYHSAKLETKKIINHRLSVEAG